MGGKEICLWRYWPFWGLHFGIHLLIGIVAMAAGLIVVAKGQVLNGLALCGAALFAIVNGWAGYKQLWKSKKRRINAT